MYICGGNRKESPGKEVDVVGVCDGKRSLEIHSTWCLWQGKQDPIYIWGRGVNV